jgi:hypothetical protein
MLLDPPFKEFSVTNIILVALFRIENVNGKWHK